MVVWPVMPICQVALLVPAASAVARPLGWK
jgi:hypothetical protein